MGVFLEPRDSLAVKSMDCCFHRSSDPNHSSYEHIHGVHDDDELLFENQNSRTVCGKLNILLSDFALSPQSTP